MRGLVIASLLALAILIGGGTGYLIGSRNFSQATTTLTNTTTTTTSSFEIVTTTSTHYPIPGDLGPWHLGSYGYPLFAPYLQCVANGGYVYCVNGNNGTTLFPGDSPNTTRTYYAHLTLNGTGPWTRTTDYPLGIIFESCVASSNYVYCIGGQNGINGHTILATYFAPLSPSGIGAWEQTTSYPQPSQSSCTTDSGSIFCIGPHFDGARFTNTTDLYFTQATPTGLGSWKLATPPSNFAGVCSASNGFLYCFAGGGCPHLYPPSSCPSPTYYAPITSPGIGNWTRTSVLPIPGSGLYVTADGYLYDFWSPAEYFTQVSSSGLSPWQPTTPYPGQSPASCVSSGAVVYCIGGYVTDTSYVDNVYYAEVIG